MILLILIAIAILLKFWFAVIKPLNYWKVRNVVHDKPMIICGSMFYNMLQKEAFPEVVLRLYNTFKNERYFGFHQLTTPTFVVNDLELIKQIGIKDFDNFPEHLQFSSEEIDPLWSKNLFASKADVWREMRPKISPTFTSSKMKMMFNLMVECAEQLSKYFSEQKEEVVEVEMKDVSTRYTNDVIATCVFGFQSDSLKDKNNEFYIHGLKITDFNGFGSLRFLSYTVSPFLSKLFKIKIISDKTGNFFRQIIFDSIKKRTEQKIIRPDLIHLLMEARKGLPAQESKPKVQDSFATADDFPMEKQETKKFLNTDDDIVAQALIFFFAGFETSSTLMSFIAYELAVNPDVQEKLHEETKATLEECDGKITYEAIMKMKYLDMVVSETLRKWPPNSATDRICSKDYVVEAKHPGEKPVIIDKGTNVWFPIFGIHRDSKYYQNPEKFDPERFSEENKSKINPFTFIPFGLGPRNCIGSRFALLENKLIIFEILKNFEIVPVKKTCIPLILSKKNFNLQVQDGMWLGFKKRQ